MRGTSAVVALTVGLVAAWGAGPAQATATAISAVDIGWTDATHTKIRVTWSESAPVANNLALKSTVGDLTLALGTTTAAGPNEFVVATSVLGHSTDPSERARIVVADQASTNQAMSVDFDRFLDDPRPRPNLTTDGVAHWTAESGGGGDATLGDPLDLPKVYRYTPVQRVAGSPAGACQDIQLPSTATPEGVMPNPGRPYHLYLRVANEWGEQLQGPEGVTTTSAVRIIAPASTAYGASTTITGSLVGSKLVESGTTCQEQVDWVLSRPLVLQARPSSTAAWTVVRTGQTDGLSRYKWVVQNQGLREYRVVRPNESAAYGAASAGKIVRASTRVFSAKFVDPTLTYGAKPQAYLWVVPSGSQRAALQFKNASGGWQGVQYKVLYAGRGVLQFSWSRRGVTQFRWWVPGQSGADPTYTSPFSLTVR